jgi:hypothetical protein
MKFIQKTPDPLEFAPLEFADPLEFANKSPDAASGLKLIDPAR